MRIGVDMADGPDMTSVEIIAPSKADLATEVDRWLKDGFGFRCATYSRGEFRAYLIKEHTIQ